MKISRKDVSLLIGLVGILAMFLSYFLVYQSVMVKADALERENRELQVQINDLTIKSGYRDTYIADTARMKQEIDAIYQRFPVEVREEDAILFTAGQESAASMLIDSIQIGVCEPVILPDLYAEDVSENTDLTVGEANIAESPSQLMRRNVTFNYVVSYEGLKKSIEAIGAQNNRMSINSLTVSYDRSTGLLTGMTSVDLYCIPGQPDKEYIQPDFSSVLSGTDNIFGSITFHTEEKTETVDEKTEDEAEEADEETQ